MMTQLKNKNGYFYMNVIWCDDQKEEEKNNHDMNEIGTMYKQKLTR